MAKVKIINGSLDSNLNGTNFTNVPSETLFSFGKFSITSNFDKASVVKYENQLTGFVKPVTLDSIGLTESQSDIIHNANIKAVLNLDNSNLNTFVKFGSAYELLRISIQNIILSFPGSLFSNSQTVVGGNITFFNFQYNSLTNEAVLSIPSPYIDNVFGLIFNRGNISTPDNNTLKNLNLSYDKYVIWSTYSPDNNSCKVIGFTGDTAAQPYLVVKTFGNPFPFLTNTTQGKFDFHIKPNNEIFEEYRANLSDYERFIISERDGTNGFRYTLKEPTLLDDGNIVFSNASLLWKTTNGYSVDINTSAYQRYLDSVLTIGTKYDTVKTDLIARFLSPSSLKIYDLTEDGKMTKLLRIYGREFDQLKEFIDSLVYINRVTYDKKNNVPDQLIGNLAKTFGWNYFTLLNESELMSKFLNVDDSERNLHEDLLPAEVDIELWRRILINTNYFWKSKGTRDAIKAIFLMIGIPEPFIDLTEHVYTVKGKIDPRQATLVAADFPSNSLPYDNSGYPKAPLETNDFYFQISGNTDGGQTYMNAFRKAGFELIPTIDNKKSWVQTGSTTRVHHTTPSYYQEDSQLVLNTKEIDISLDTSRGIEWDLWYYITHIDYPANSTDYMLPYSFVNISIGLTGGTQSTFKLPSNYKSNEGDLEIRFNGILLNAPKSGTTPTNTNADYTISGNEFTLTNGVTARQFTDDRDVIQATYLYSGGTITGATIKYIVTRVNADMTGTVIPLPNAASGDVQVTINGVALTKTTNQFVADYTVDPYNLDQIIIQNPDVIAYLAAEPHVQVAYLTISGSSTIASRSEVMRIDSFNSSKIYYNVSANKYVYKLNYKIQNASEVKVLIDGIALEPNTDYTLNTSNPYEIFLPSGLRFRSVISLYYIVGGDEFKNPIISPAFGLGDLSKLSFMEFIELIQRRLINATNRKTITDFKGGWYPTLLKIYITYLKRGLLPTSNPLHSNAYTFMNLYPFLSKYNAFFQRFVDELLSATIIIRKGGLLIRNTVFTRQKFPYKRGVYMGHIKHQGLAIDPTTYTVDTELYYFGNDGSDFYKRQEDRYLRWSDDYVCGDYNCNLNVTGVTVTFPVNIRSLFVLGSDNKVYIYDVLQNTMTYLFTAPSDAREIANSGDKLWLTGDNRFLEYGYVSDPISVSTTFKEITYTVNPGAGLIAKDNETLISTNGNNVYFYDVLGTSVVDSVFTADSSKSLIGDILYNVNNDNYIIVNNEVGNSCITQYKSDGTVLASILISQNDIVGLFQYENDFYAVKANLENSSLYKVTATGLEFVRKFNIKVLGVSQDVNSITIDIPA